MNWTDKRKEDIVSEQDILRESLEVAALKLLQQKRYSKNLKPFTIKGRLSDELAKMFGWTSASPQSRALIEAIDAAWEKFSQSTQQD